VQVILPEPFAPFMVSMGMGILPKHLFAGQNINTTALNRKPVGTGPFIFKEWKSGSYVRLTRNPHYHAGPVGTAEVVFKVYPETNTALVALESAEIHENDIPPKDLPRFSKNRSLNLFLYDQLQYFYIGFNQDGLFKDKNLRLAFAQAIDKDKMIKVLFKGLYTPAHAPMPKVSWAYEPQVKKYEFNPAQSKKLIEASGYKFNLQTGYYEKNGKTLAFEILLPQGRRDSQRACEMMQQFLKQAGMKMELRSMEWTALLKILNAPTGPKKFEVTMMGWSAGIDPDGYSIWHSSQYPQGFNFIHYQNKNVDELLIKGRRTLDQKKRREIYSQIQKLISEDQPYYFLWYPKSITAISKKVGGYDSQPGPAGPFLKTEKIFVVE
jgi:peptide/nickel transport system substrate-binding protein